MAALRRARYGRSSEKLDEHIYQLELMLEDLGASVSEQRICDSQTTETTDDAKSERSPTNRQSLPAQLPRERHPYELSDVCEGCGQSLVAFDKDTSELLEYVPASFRVIEQVRPKYRCGCSDKIHQAEAPSRPIMRSYAGPGLLAHVAVAKFLDHLPLYRQSHIYSREGVELSRSTLADRIGLTCALLRPLDEALKRYVMAAEKLHTDDTPVPVLQPDANKPSKGDCGVISEMITMPASTHRQQSGSVIHQIAKPGGRLSTRRGMKGSYKPTAMRVTINYTPPEKSRKPDAGHM